MNLLLDTTIQIDRITGSKERKKAVEEVLEGNHLYCSTYVLGEYYSNIVNDLVTLYSLFRMDRDMGETGKRITERVFGRSQARMAKLYANILELCEFEVGEIEDTFLLYMDLIQDEFFMGLEEVLNKTKCVRAERKIVYEDGIPVLSAVSCTKEKEVCAVCSLWKESKEEVQRLIESQEVDEKVRQILCTAKENGKEYRGRNCMTLGDTVISLEALKSEQELGICSSNKKDFQPICDVIELKLIKPDYSVNIEKKQEL